MKPQYTIVVTPYLVDISPADKKGPPAAKHGGKKPPAPAPKMRYRWRAEITCGDWSGPPVEGHTSPDEAIGALIRNACLWSGSVSDALDLVASLFGDLSFRSPDMTLGRALRLAARNPKRVTPGCAVTIGEPGEAVPASEGGAE